MSLCPTHKGLPRWSYVIMLISLLPPVLLWLVPFATSVIWLPFDEYRIIWVVCGCFSSLGFIFTPLITAATSRFCSELNVLVANEAIVLMVLPFLLSRSFSACSIAGYFTIRCWLSQLSCDHFSFPYHLMRLLMPTPFHFDLYFLCLVLRGLIDHPYHGLFCIQILHICLLFILSQPSWPHVSIYNFLMISGFLGKAVI